MKDDQRIMVVNKEVLFPNLDFEGFKPQDEADYESIILANHEYLRR